jgi:hypothetical protein
MPRMLAASPCADIRSDWDEEMEKAVATADIVRKIVFSEDENPRNGAYVDSINCEDSREGILGTPARIQGRRFREAVVYSKCVCCSCKNLLIRLKGLRVHIQLVAFLLSD